MGKQEQDEFSKDRQQSRYIMIGVMLFVLLLSIIFYIKEWFFNK